MQYVSSALFISAFLILMWIVLPNLKWFRKLIGGKWYYIRDRRDPYDKHYWSKALDTNRSCVKEIENYSGDVDGDAGIR